MPTVKPYKANIKSLFQYKTEQVLLMGFKSWDDFASQMEATEFDAVNTLISRHWAETFIRGRQIEYSQNVLGVPYKEVSKNSHVDPYRKIFGI